MLSLAQETMVAELP